MAGTLAALLVPKICGIAAVFVGWGYLSARLLDMVRRPESNWSSSLRLPELGIIGFGGAYLFAVLAGLVAPLGGAVDWIFAGIGIAGFGWMAAAWFQRRKWRWADFGWLAALTLFVAWGTAYTPLNYDAGLYQLQAARYFESGPLPLGIANVHDRLGFNSAWLPISVLCSGSIFGKDGLFLVNGAAILIFLGAIGCHALDQYRRGRFGISGACAGAAVFLFVRASSGVLFSWFSLSPGADLPAAMICCWVLVAFLALLENAAAGEVHDRDVEIQRWFFVLVTATALAIITKLSQGPVALLLALALFLPGARRVWGRAIAFAVLLVAGWLVQGLTTSGCAAFPVARSCLAFLPWTSDPAVAARQAMVIRSWARAPGVRPENVPNGFGWLPLWWHRMMPEREFVWSLARGAAVLAGVAAILMIAVWIGSIANKEKDRANILKPALLALLVFCAGAAFWFLEAPDPRFGLGFLIGIPAFVFALAVEVSLQRQGARQARRLLAATLAVLVVWAGLSESRRLHRERGAIASYSWSQIPVPRLRSMTTSGGVTIRLPVKGDQCWDEPTPCTPEPGVAGSLHQSTLLGHTMYSHEKQ